MKQASKLRRQKVQLSQLQRKISQEETKGDVVVTTNRVRGKRGRSARNKFGTPYQRLLADPAAGPLAQLPDGYGAKTFVTRLEAVNTATTGSNSTWFGLFRPWNVGPVLPPADIRSDGRAMGPVIYWDETTTSSAANWYARNAATYSNINSTINGFFDKIRFLCAELDAQYIGPHGDNQTGVVYVNSSYQGMRIASHHDEFGHQLTVPQAGTAPVEVGTTAIVPIDFKTSSVGNPTANSAYAPTYLQALPSTKVCAVGTSFKVKLYPKSVVGDGFYPRSANGYDDQTSTADTAWGMVPEVIAESLPNVFVNIVGGPATTAMYRFTLRSVFEVTPSYSMAAFIPGSLPPNEPRVVEASKTLMEKLSEAVLEVFDTSLPYLSSAATAGIMYAAKSSARRLGQALP